MHGQSIAASQLGNAGANTPARSTQVGVQLSELQDAISYLENQMAVLENRLSGVLRLSPPSPGAGVASAPQECICPVADAIRAAKQRIHAMNSTISDYCDRLEA